MGTFIRADFISTDKSAPKVVPVYAADTFTRADNAVSAGAAEVGGYSWRATDSGTASILGNQLTLKVGSAATALALIDDGRADGVLSARISKVAALSGLAFRVDASNTGYVLYTNGSNYEFKTKTATDAYGPSFPTTPERPPSASGDLLEVILRGPSITAKVNGITVASVTDSSRNGTGKGFFVRNTTGTFDEFLWTPLPS